MVMSRAASVEMTAQCQQAQLVRSVEQILFRKFGGLRNHDLPVSRFPIGSTWPNRLCIADGELNSDPLRDSVVGRGPQGW